VMPDRTAATALEALESLRLRVNDHVWPEVPEALKPTISAGLVLAEPRTWAVHEVLAEADARLYAAKRAGRNRIVA
jgi:diguanylate cyclase (GGDEF)-like protein